MRAGRTSNVDLPAAAAHHHDTFVIIEPVVHIGAIDKLLVALQVMVRSESRNGLDLETKRRVGRTRRVRGAARRAED